MSTRIASLSLIEEPDEFGHVPTGAIFYDSTTHRALWRIEDVDELKAFRDWLRDEFHLTRLNGHDLDVYYEMFQEDRNRTERTPRVVELEVECG